MKIEIEDTELHKLVESIKLLTEEISKLRQQQLIPQVVYNPPVYYVPPVYQWPNNQWPNNLQTSNTIG
jgi:hypothetical protein